MGSLETEGAVAGRNLRDWAESFPGFVANRARMLFTVWAWTRADGSLQVYVGPEAFAEFYPVTAEQVASLLGPDGLYWMGDSEVDEFVTNLDRLFEIIAQG